MKKNNEKFIFLVLFLVGVTAIIACNFYYKFVSFLLPFILFLVGFALGYFVQNFKNSLIFGSITTIIGTIIAIVIFFINNSLSGEFIFYSLIGAMGIFFGFGFGSITYLRINNKKDKIKKFEKIITRK